MVPTEANKNVITYNFRIFNNVQMVYYHDLICFLEVLGCLNNSEERESMTNCFQANLGIEWSIILKMSPIWIIQGRIQDFKLGAHSK